MNTSNLLRVPDVAQRLNCGVSTVYSLIERGQLPHHRCPGIRVSEEQIASFLATCQRGPVTERKQTRTASRPRLRDMVLD